MSSSPRTLCVVTGTRAEYGLLRTLIGEIDADPELRLQLLVTGMHLSEDHGSTWREIESDGFAIDRKVDMRLEEDTPGGIARSIGRGVAGMADALGELEPDMAVLLGDRFEVLAAAVAAVTAGIPLAHIHGGETTEGAFDESFRHAVTKMSHLHFTSTEAYRRRVIQLGEQPHRVFHTGAPGLDNLERMELLGRDAFADSIGFQLHPRNLLITFHPETLEPGAQEKHFRALLEAADALDDCGLIFTLPNADTGGRGLIAMVERYVEAHPDRACAFASLGQRRYLSALRHVDAVAGNSSSALIEAPSFGTPAVNVGSRQDGRIKPGNVIDCVPEREAIAEALDTALSAGFRARMEGVDNPYYREGSSRRIKEILKESDLGNIMKKRFFDLDFSLPDENNGLR